MNTSEEPPGLLLKGHRVIWRWGQVASVQLTTCFYLVSKLRISGDEPHCPKCIHGVQKDNVKCMFKLEIRAETSLVPLAVTVSEFNANVKCRQVLVKSLCCSVYGNQPQALLNANRRKDMVQFLAAQLYLFTECLQQHDRKLSTL